MSELYGNEWDRGIENKDTIDSIKLLIQSFNEQAESEENFDEIIDDRPKFYQFFKTLRAIIEKLKQLPEFKDRQYIEMLDSKFKETVNKYYDILSDAIDLEFEQEMPEDYRNPDRPNQIAEYIYEKEEIKEDLKRLIELTKANYNVFETLYLKQEQEKDLIIKPEEKGIKVIFTKFINAITGKNNRLDEKKEDLHKQEVDSNKKAFRSSLKKGVKKYWEIEPSQINLNNSEEFVKWEKRLEKYLRKIDKGEFGIEDMPEFIRDYSGVSFKNRLESKNYYVIQSKLKMIRSIFAEYYECSEDEIFIDSYFDIDHKEHDVKDIPYKVIFGDVCLSQKKNKIGSCLEIIIGDADFSNTDIESIDSIRIIYGYGDFASSRIKSLGKLRLIGNGASFYKCKIKDFKSLENIFGRVEWGENKKLKKYIKTKQERDNNHKIDYEK